MDSSLHQTSLSMGFSRQEYWSGLPFPSPGNLPNPRIKHRSLTLQTDASLSHRGSPTIMMTFFKRFHACTAALSAPSPAAGHCWPTPPPASLGQDQEEIYIYILSEERRSNSRSSFIFIFYWSIITLQCCVNFYYIVKWISYMYAYILIFLDLPPTPPLFHSSRSSESTELSFLCYSASSH